MINSKKIVAAFVFATLASSGAAHAASSVTASASATIATPIAISQTAALDFGSVSASAAAGTAVLSTTGTLSVTGGVGALGGVPSAAAFNVSGQAGAAYAITLPTSASLASGANSMTITGFSHNAGLTPALTAGSASNFNVGATLNIAAGQIAGAYSGTYAVTVNYN